MNLREKALYHQIHTLGARERSGWLVGLGLAIVAAAWRSGRGLDRLRARRVAARGG